MPAGGRGFRRAPASAPWTRVSSRGWRRPLPGARLGPAAEPARRVWASVWAAHRHPLSHSFRSRPDKDALGLAARGLPGESDGRGALRVFRAAEPVALW